MDTYEKAYKAVLETARMWIKDGCSVGEQTCLECVFPELRESEDEKIRKFLIDYFTSYKIGNVATKLNGYRIDDILAYLEKQKEQKPAEWSEEDEEMLEYVIGDVNDAKELFATKESIDLCDKEIAWLKSLRPSTNN